MGTTTLCCVGFFIVGVECQALVGRCRELWLDLEPTCFSRYRMLAASHGFVIMLENLSVTH